MWMWIGVLSTKLFIDNFTLKQRLEHKFLSRFCVAKMMIFGFAPKNKREKTQKERKKTKIAAQHSVILYSIIISRKRIGCCTHVLLSLRLRAITEKNEDNVREWQRERERERDIFVVVAGQIEMEGRFVYAHAHR